MNSGGIVRMNKVFGDGLFYAADIAGSDIERHPESFSNQLGRHYPECLYQNGTYASSYGLTSYLKEDLTHILGLKRETFN